MPQCMQCSGQMSACSGDLSPYRDTAVRTYMYMYMCTCIYIVIMMSCAHALNEFCGSLNDLYASYRVRGQPAVDGFLRQHQTHPHTIK